MDLSIIIVNFNTRELLKNCLQSIFSQEKEKVEVWVVDNASDDGSTQMIKKDFPQVKVIQNQENLGFAHANNQALKKAQGRFLFLLNSDTMLKYQSLTKIINFLTGNPEVGACGVKILDPDGTVQPSAGKFYHLVNVFLMLFGGERLGLLRESPSKTKEVDWVSGAALIVRKEILGKPGLLDEDFFMYMEEVEWCFRIREAGFKIFFYPEAEIIHYVRASGSKSEAIWGIYKGLIYFYEKHKPPWHLKILRVMLKVKAILAWTCGLLTNNYYLKNTYSEAFHLA